MHDNQPGDTFAGLHEGMGHVLWDEKRITWCQAHDVAADLKLEVALTNKEPFVTVRVEVQRRSHFLGPERVEHNAAPFRVLS